jgi:DNA-binding NarL/FixJ family response regulator
VENRTSVIIPCSNRLLRESVERILTKRTDFKVIAVRSFPCTSLRELADCKADVMVLDSLQLLGEDPVFVPNHRNRRSIKCMLVAMEDDQQRFLTAIRLGALGYVLQEASAVEVVNAIRCVAQGEAVCPARYARILFDYFASQPSSLPNTRARKQLGLTRREQQLVPLIDQGKTNKEIGNQLNISEQTVKNHIHRILRKVGAEDRLSVFSAFQSRTLGL